MKRIIIISIAFLTSFQIANGQVTSEHLDAYLWEYPLQQTLVIDPELMEELVEEIEKIIQSGDLFFRPLPNDYADQIWDHYFLYIEPGRILKTIAMAYPYLETGMQETLRAMVQDLFADPVHRPWAAGPLPFDAGKERKPFAPETLWGQNSNWGLYRPTIQNIYNIWLYVYRTGHVDDITPAYYSQISSFYNSKLGSSDRGRLYGSMKAHIGMARLAEIFEDNGLFLTARNALESALNFGLNTNDVDTLASRGHSNQYWDGAYRYLYEWSPANPPWPNMRNWDWVNRNYIFHNISPEIGRYLNDYLQSQTEARHDYMMNRFPLWWLREAPYFNRWTGDEGIGTPSSSFGTNVPLERWFRNVDAETLASYMISSPVGIADSYWIEALVMAIEANATDIWVDVRTTPFQTDIQQDFVWTGNESNDWNNPANWQNNEIPGAADNVIIPATATFFPTLLATGACNNMLLESSASGTASLIDNGLLTVHGTATVQRHIDAANWEVGTDGWHFLSSPVASQAIADDWTPAGEGNDYDFYAWTDADVELPWLNQKVPANNLTHFVPGIGYLAAYQSGGVRTFEGALNTGAVGVNLSRSPGSAWTGWNLLGNPYPSSIDWNLAGRSLFEDNFAYIYNTNREGGAGYELIDGGAANALIAPHQGFYVRAGDGSHNQTFTFTNDIRAHGGAWLKTDPLDDILRIRLSHENFFDETILRLRVGSAFGRDRQDALKLFSFNPEAPQLYSFTSDNVRVAINSIPAIPEEGSVALGLMSPAQGVYTISLSGNQGEFLKQDIFLEDILTGIKHKLAENMTYSFHADAGEMNDRFILKFAAENDPELSETLDAYAYGKTLFVINHKEEALVEMVNSTGQTVLSKKVGEGMHSFETKLTAGAYFVRLTSHDETVSRKVILF